MFIQNKVINFLKILKKYSILLLQFGRCYGIITDVV